MGAGQRRLLAPKLLRTQVGMSILRSSDYCYVPTEAPGDERLTLLATGALVRISSFLQEHGELSIARLHELMRETLPEKLSRQRLMRTLVSLEDSGYLLIADGRVRLAFDCPVE